MFRSKLIGVTLRAFDAASVCKHMLSACARAWLVCAYGMLILLALGGCSSTLTKATVMATPYQTCSSPHSDTPSNSDIASQGKRSALSTQATQLDTAFAAARKQQIFLDNPKDLFFGPGDVAAALKLLDRATALQNTANQGQLKQGQPGNDLFDPTPDLISRIPWLDQPIGGDTAALLPSKPAIDAANVAMSIIDSLAFKHGSVRSDLMPIATRKGAANAPVQPDVASTPEAASESKALERQPITTVGEDERKSLSIDFQQIAAFRAFHLITLLSAGRIVQDFRNPSGQVDDHALLTHVRIFNIARFLSTYFDAYFRGGQFIAYTFDKDGEVALASDAISRRIGSELGNALPPARVKQIVSSEIGSVCGKGAAGLCASLVLGKTSFVTRAGLSVQFAGVGVSVGSGQSLAPQATYPKASEFGPQMIRVLIEAIFDANGPHPVSVHQSTACVSGLFTASECLGASEQPTEMMTRIDTLAAGGEALTSAGVGAIIRGANVSALNNEAVANMLETFAGVSSRKVLERVLQAQSDSCDNALRPVVLQVVQGATGL